MSTARPPVAMAFATGVAVLLVYIATLAPTVTFWDAGEFITAARTLGIPHPPGTPLYVLLASVWGRVFAIGAYAWRTNMFSAICSAAAAGFWFLFAHDALMRIHSDVDERSREVFSVMGGVAAALLASFTFSTWQSATETEVYASAMLAVAIVAWLSARWRARRSMPAGSRLLLLALYLCALTMGDHLLGLLVGPALIASLAVASRRAPLGDPTEQSAEWSRVLVVAAAWLLLVGVGLGNGALAIVGAGAFALAAMHARRTRQLRFAVVASVLAVAGASTLLFLLLRAQQHPWLDAGSPANWRSLLDVVRRAQYPVRTPLDDPTVMHGPGNPGRSLALAGYQFANYAQYFDWQWAAGFGDLALKSNLRAIVTVAMAALGIRGALVHRRGDITSFAFVATLFLVAGPLLVLYLNFRPGPSIGWNRWLQLIEHEVRDRDYFFVGSFVAWSVWVAVALADIARQWIPRVRVRWRPAVLAVFAVALIPLTGNYAAATRRDSPDATLARDFAIALLESVPIDGVLFTNGDNDTFPLWYAQQVEGIRRDVTVVCLSLAAAPPYIHDLRESHQLVVDRIDSLRPFRAAGPLTLPLPGHDSIHVAAGQFFTPSDVLVIEVLRAAAGRRPIAWTIGGADELFGLGPQLVQRGLALILPVGQADTAGLIDGAAAGPGGVRFDYRFTRTLVDSVWRFGRLEAGGYDRLDPNIQVVARAVAAPIGQTGVVEWLRGDTTAALQALRRAVRIGADSLALATLRRLGR